MSFPLSSRVKCLDLDSVHTKVIYETSKSKFVQLGNLVNSMYKLYPGKVFSETDHLCKYCHARLDKKIHDLSSSEESQEQSQSNQDVTSSQDVSDQELL